MKLTLNKGEKITIASYEGERVAHMDLKCIEGIGIVNTMGSREDDI